MPTSFQLTPLIDIARAEERRVSLGVRDVVDEWRAFAGGIAARAEPGVWTNGAYGAGLNGPVAATEVRDLVEWYSAAGIEPRVELCPFADRSLVDALAAERFVVRSFENVFFLDLRGVETLVAPHAAPASLRIEAVDVRDAAAVEAHARMACSGFMPENEPLPAEFLKAAMRSSRHASATAVAAFLGDRLVGAGTLVVGEGVAGCFGVSVAKDVRRQGIQQALLIWRLRRAAAVGARWATISGRPGEATERNARRMGFQVAYTRAVMVCPGPGRAPVKE